MELPTLAGPARHPPHRGLLGAGAGDPDAVRNARDLAAALGPQADTRTAVLSSGGHNYHVWYGLSPAALDWLGARLPTPRPAGG